jgi:hypothetical protein
MPGLEPAEGEQGQPMGRPEQQLQQGRARQWTKPKHRQPLRQPVERTGEEEKGKGRGRHSAGEEERGCCDQQQGGREQPAGANRGRHQPRDQEVLERWQQVAARPVAAAAFRGAQQVPVEGERIRLGGSGKEGLLPRRDRHQPGAGLHGAPKQGGMQVPVPQYPHRVGKKGRVYPRQPGPAMTVVDPLKGFVPLLVGKGQDGPVVRLGKFGKKACRRRHAVRDLKHGKARIEAGSRLARVTYRNDADAI